MKEDSMRERKEATKKGYKHKTNTKVSGNN